jgi:hypothetical protein
MATTGSPIIAKFESACRAVQIPAERLGAEAFLAEFREQPDAMKVCLELLGVQMINEMFVLLSSQVFPWNQVHCSKHAR